MRESVCGTVEIKVVVLMNECYKKTLRILAVILLDVLLIAVCGMVALLVRFDFSFNAIGSEYKQQLLYFLCVQSGVTIVIFMLRRMYHYVWRSVSAYDVADMTVSVAAAFIVTYIVSRLAGIRIPNSVAAIDLLCIIIALVGMRCFLRFYESLSRAFLRMSGGDRIMLIGAGEAGRVLLRELLFSNKTKGKVCCIVDDNQSKWGKRMNGVRIYGGRGKIAELAKEKKITHIIFAIPSASAADKQEILKLCQDTGCKVQTLPGVYQMVNGEASLAEVKDVQVEDLLGREPIKLNNQAVTELMQGKVVLVTGGGGSIGSELCRQIAGCKPKQLIILDIYENNAYDIQQELLSKHKELNLKVEIASIRDKEKIYSLFKELRPEIVFHAAAHKHVPLMESCTSEAVKNNIFGTYHVVRAAEKYGVQKFVMISTDKAVNPTNFMGATKRFCEMILQSRQKSSTEFCAVRFGNVLGSNGSVVPLFKRQIAAGGPITLTDKRIIRYFMTIEEASQLVLEAGAIAHPGQIFVLDMGEPVKILTLAENLIRLSGLEPYKDIEIKEIGLRPGEKLYEELITGGAGQSKTVNEKIFVEQQETISPDYIMDCLEKLDCAVTDNISNREMIELMKDIVSTYYDPKQINSVAVGKVAEIANS